MDNVEKRSIKLLFETMEYLQHEWEDDVGTIHGLDGHDPNACLLCKIEGFLTEYLNYKHNADCEQSRTT